MWQMSPQIWFVWTTWILSYGVWTRIQDFLPTPPTILCDIVYDKNKIVQHTVSLFKPDFRVIKFK